MSRFEGKNRGWWQEMGQAFDSCKAFLKYNTKLSADTTAAPSASVQPRRLGVHVAVFASPAHFRVFRQFMLDFVDDFGARYKVSSS